MSLDLSNLTPDQVAELQNLMATMQTGQPAPPAKRKFAVIKSPRDVAMFRIIYHRGLRASEVKLLQLSDWNRERDRIRFARLKGSNGGEYHLTSREVRALRTWLRIRGDVLGPLFPSRRGKGISQQMLDVLMKRYGSQAGLPPELCHTHALKHSAATHLLNRGESIEDVQDHLGHANIQSTLVYAKYSAKRRDTKDARLREW